MKTIVTNPEQGVQIAILPNSNGIKIPLDASELADIDLQLKTAIQIREKQFYDYDAKFPNKAAKNEYILQDLSNYKRQYVVTLNEKNEKEIWINCFCDTHDYDWQNEKVIVFDGGNCYFEVNINLTQRKVINFHVNGEA